MKLRLLAAVMDRLGVGRRRPHGRAETPNQSSSATVTSITAAIRSAENGDTRLLFALYRDMLLGGSHVASEFSTRKLAVLNDPITVTPADPTAAEDVRAAEACRAMIAQSVGWTAAMGHLLDGILWPVSVMQRVYRPAVGMPGLRYTLDRLVPISPEELCFRHNTQMARTAEAGAATAQAGEMWEPGVRLYAILEDGRIDYSHEKAEPLDPSRYITHRGYAVGAHTARDYWGGPARALLFWWFMANGGRDWFARAIERFGSPFLVGKTDTKDPEAVTAMENAFATSTRIHGLVVNHDDAVELSAAAVGGDMQYPRFIDLCNEHISRFILGQTLATKAEATGMGSGSANLQGQVREDLRQWDRLALAETVRQQIFRPFLEINGLRGAPPVPKWGTLGLEEAKATADLLGALKTAGLEPSDDSLPQVEERVGFALQRVAPPTLPGGPLPGGPLTPGNPLGLTALRVDPLPLAQANDQRVETVDRLAAEHAPAVGRLLAGISREVRALVLTSTSAADLEQRLAQYATSQGWLSERMAEEVELALQLFAVAGLRSRGGDRAGRQNARSDVSR